MVLTSKARQFLPLGACRPVNALAGIPLGLLHPSGNRLCCRLELTRQLLGRASRSRQIDHLSPKLRRISGSVTGHQTPQKINFKGVHQTGSTPAHAVLIFDRAGWHTTPNLVMPKNITPIWLPSRAPELNPVETIWQYLRANWLSNRVFETFDDIVDAICDAWNKLITQPETIAFNRNAMNGPTSVRPHDSWYKYPLDHAEALVGVGKAVHGPLVHRFPPKGA
jgi:DDE superfamily endonuclease